MITGLPDVSLHDAEALAMRLDPGGADAPTRPCGRISGEADDVPDIRERDGRRTRRLQRAERSVRPQGRRRRRWLLDVELQSTYGVGGSLRCASIVAA